jgi:hypothetical protein
MRCPGVVVNQQRPSSRTIYYSLQFFFIKIKVRRIAKNKNERARVHVLSWHKLKLNLPISFIN